MKSLDKLKSGRFVPNGKNTVTDVESKADSRRMADEIEFEIGKYYFRKPLFEDGKPVTKGDTIDTEDGTFEITGILYDIETGMVTLVSDGVIYELDKGEQLKRPLDIETQDDLDRWVEEFALTITESGEMRDKAVDGIKRILAQQRFLDRV